ncbi:MAG: class E sortase [Candidatus Daviesbacteria bacterium]|nr:class E sortase [Candidatus Daviesbacteria bacterium]
MDRILVAFYSLIFVFMLVFAGQAFAADLSVKIETPKGSVRENSFKIGFVTLDIQGRSVTVKCMKKGPSDGGFSQFGSDFAFTAGGNSGDCEVTSSIISTEGTYEFKVSAQAGAEIIESPTVTVVYTTGLPGAPSYSKEQSSSCDYKIKFKTADDGRTANVKIVPNVDPFNVKDYQIALTRGVAHAKGTAFPNGVGNVFLFSHSSVSFYEANRYNSIFYLLDKLAVGDEIDLYYLNSKFEYSVTEKKVVDAADIKYLASSGSGRTVTLMTCWPPGTSFKRLMVIAKLN